MCLNHDMSLSEDIQTLPGLHCYGEGQIGLSEQLLESWQQLDTIFLNWAREIKAKEHLFPSLIAVRELQKIDYFASFPHLATFAVTLDPTESNLSSFRDNNSTNETGEVALTKTDDVQYVLTPAACYHFYIHYQGRNLGAPLYLTTRCTCHRRESRYQPLQRQWSFNMRELVCLGTQEEVDQFLVEQQNKISEFVAGLGIDAHWQTATDPFFQPENNEIFLAQRLLPIKQELVLENELAIASVNRHYQHFGGHFAISRDNQSAFSGCVAFGLERWLYALEKSGQDDSVLNKIVTEAK